MRCNSDSLRTIRQRIIHQCIISHSKSSLRSIVGYSLLEFAVVAAVTLPIVFGAVDITNTMRAYNALEKGSEVALRCIYPTDAGCMRAYQNGGTRLFNWVRQDVQDQFFVRDMQYRGLGEWLAYPTYSYNQFRANILDSVSYGVPQVRVTESVPVMNKSHRVGVIVRRSGLPWVLPENEVNPNGRSVLMRRTEQRNSGAFPETAITVTSNEREINSVNDTLRYTFTLDNPFPNYSTVRQFKAQPDYFDNPGSAIPRSKTFGEVVSGAESHTLRAGGRTKALVHVKGVLENQAAGTMSKLLLRINGSDQGGQMLSENGNANFYPRGVGSSNRDGDSSRRRVDGSAGFMSAEEWNHEVELRWGENTIEVTPTMQDASGNAVYGWSAGQRWRITDVSVYIPTYRLVSFDQRCQAPGCGNQPCPTFEGLPVYAENAVEARYPSALLVGDVSNQPTGQVIPQELGTFLSAQEAQQQQSCSGSTLSIENLSPEQQTQSCPENFGARDDAERQLACPVQDTRLAAAGVSPITPTYQERQISLTPPRGLERDSSWNARFSKSECNSSFTLTAPSAVTAYRALIMPDASAFDPTQTTYTPIAGNERRPQEIKSSETRYQCDEIVIQSQVFNGNQHPRAPENLSTRSMFAGTHSERVGSQACNIPLRQDAEANGLPHGAWFEWTATPVREVRLNSRPSDLCTIFRTESAQGGSKPEVVASYLPERETPPACVGDSRCTRVFAGFDRTDSANNQESLVDLERAKSIAFDAVVASYPHARKQCTQQGSENCLNTTIELDDPRNPKLASVRSSIAVPLTLLGGNSVTLSNRQARELETSFLR